MVMQTITSRSSTRLSRPPVTHLRMRKCANCWWVMKPVVGLAFWAQRTETHTVVSDVCENTACTQSPFYTDPETTPVVTTHRIPQREGKTTRDKGHRPHSRVRSLSSVETHVTVSANELVDPAFCRYVVRLPTLQRMDYTVSLIGYGRDRHGINTLTIEVEAQWVRWVAERDNVEPVIRTFQKERVVVPLNRACVLTLSRDHLWLKVKIAKSKCWGGSRKLSKAWRHQPLNQSEAFFHLPSSWIATEQPVRSPVTVDEALDIVIEDERTDLKRSHATTIDKRTRNYLSQCRMRSSGLRSYEDGMFLRRARKERVAYHARLLTPYPS